MTVFVIIWGLHSWSFSGSKAPRSLRIKLNWQQIPDACNLAYTHPKTLLICKKKKMAGNGWINHVRCKDLSLLSAPHINFSCMWAHYLQNQSIDFPIGCNREHKPHMRRQIDAQGWEADISPEMWVSHYHASNRKLCLTCHVAHSMGGSQMNAESFLPCCHQTT